MRYQYNMDIAITRLLRQQIDRYLLCYFPTFRMVAEFKVSVVVVELGLGSMNSEINQVLMANGVYVKMDWIQAAVEYQLAQSVMQQQQQLTAAFLADKVSHSTSLVTTFPFVFLRLLQNGIDSFRNSCLTYIWTKTCMW